MLRDLFPVQVILQPGKTFAAIASGRTGWAWPLAVSALATAASTLLFTLLPPAFIAEAFEGLTPAPGRGFAFHFAVALGGGLAFSAFISALISALARFLGEGRLSLRMIAAGLATCAFGLTALAMHGAAGDKRGAGLLAAAAVVALAAWAALSDRTRFLALLKSMLAVSALALAGALPAGAAALAGSVRGYTLAEYAFSLLSLYWLARAVTAVYGAARARAAAAVVLGILGGLAFLYLAFNLGLIPVEIFQALMLA